MWSMVLRTNPTDTVARGVFPHGRYGAALTPRSLAVFWNAAKSPNATTGEGDAFARRCPSRELPRLPVFSASKIQLSVKDFENEKLDRHSVQHQLHKVLKELRKARDQIAKLESVVSSVFLQGQHPAAVFAPALFASFPGFWPHRGPRRSSPTAVSPSPAPTAGSTRAARPRRPPKRAASWTRASWSAPVAGLTTPPAATGSCWPTSTSAWLDAALERHLGKRNRLKISKLAFALSNGSVRFVRFRGLPASSVKALCDLPCKSYLFFWVFFPVCW